MVKIIAVVRTLSAPTEPASQQGEQERAEGADAARLGRREDPAVDATDHQYEQHQHTPDPGHGAHARAPVEAFAGRAGGRIQHHRHLDGNQVEQDAEDAGHHAGDEQPADVGLGHDAVDHQDHARGGIATLDIVAAVARLEPHTALKPPQATTVAIARPPRR
jgi:hypothetical protein